MFTQKSVVAVVVFIFFFKLLIYLLQREKTGQYPFKWTSQSIISKDISSFSDKYYYSIIFDINSELIITLHIFFLMFSCATKQNVNTSNEN